MGMYKGMAMASAGVCFSRFTITSSDRFTIKNTKIMIKLVILARVAKGRAMANSQITTLMIAVAITGVCRRSFTCPSQRGAKF